jgi:hypothetical protein
MRKNILFLFLLPLFLGACNGWLDVKPEDEIDEKDLFETGTGYRHSLNGIYYGMADASLYGKHMTWGIVDALGQCYDYYQIGTVANSLNYGASNYAWTVDYFKTDVEAMWDNSYKIVANCNNLIQNIQHENPEKFAYKEKEKSMIWGEALAVRAAVQFDILRLFAPSPAMNPGNKVYVPYVSTYPSYISNQLTVDSCMNCIIRDLKDACDLLWKADSASSMSKAIRFESNSLDDNFFVDYYRGYRLNYYAATALLARACLYAQRTDEAYAYAKKLIDIRDENGYFEYDDSRISDGDIKFYSDVLWGLQSVDLLEYIGAYIDVSNPDPWYHQYLMVLNVEESFFGSDMSASGECNDLRFNHWIYALEGGDYRFVKYDKYGAEKNTEAQVSNYLVPMIRMSEVYYIAAEAIYKSNLDEAKEYLRRVKEGRGLTSGDVSMRQTNAATTNNFMEVLINDARREWLGEGQIFFMYKRLNTIIPGDGESIAIDDKIIAPIPDSETNLN